MKRLLVCVLIISLFSYCFTSCTSSYEENVFFSQELLTKSKLEDMPVPPHLDHSVSRFNGSFGNWIFLNLTDAEYEQYVEDLLEYLRAKEDIYYLGYSIGSGLLGEMIPYDDIAPVTDSYDTKGDDHHWFFSTENALTNSEMLVSPVEIRIIRESGKLDYKDFSYNTRIILTEGTVLANAMWHVCGAGHTYDEGIEYLIPGSEGTIFEYTCIHCDDTRLSDFIGDMKIYNVTIEDTDADHYIIQRPTEIVSGVLYKFSVYKLEGEYVRITINGTELSPYMESIDGRYLMYGFIMPCEDIVINTELVSEQTQAQ